MLDFSPIKILLIVVVTVVLLGPDKLPDVARTIGKAWRSVKQWQGKIEQEVRGAIPDLPDTTNLARYARSPLHLLNELADRTDPVTTVDETQESTTAEATAAAVAEPTALTLRKPLVNPPAEWQQPSGPFDPSMN